MPHQCTDCGRTFEDGSKEMLSGCPDCGGNKFQFHPDGIDADGAASGEPPEPPDPAVDSSVARTVGNAATAVRDLVGSGSSPPETSGSPPDSPEPESSSSVESRSTAESPSTAESQSPSTTAESQSPSIENDAQASARSEIVSTDDLPPTSGTPPDSASGVSPGSEPEPRSEPTPGDHGERGSSSRDEPALGDDESPETGDGTPDGDRSDDSPDLSELREELNQQFESIRVLEPGQYELNLMELFDREEYIVALQEDGKYTIQVPDRWED
jgi:predicted  nucleic acid-binding Zn-ribbon protein